jgi:steroid delta-isomerase-like uncharacterized protein
MDSKAVVRSMYEAINARQFDRFDEVIAADAAFHLAHLPAPVGRDELKASMRGYVESFPDMRLTVTDVVAEGDRVAVRLVAEGTHAGPFGAVEATGRAIAVVETDFLRLAGGQIVDGWVLYDQFTLLVQLGLLPDLATA